MVSADHPVLASGCNFTNCWVYLVPKAVEYKHLEFIVAVLRVVTVVVATVADRFAHQFVRFLEKDMLDCFLLGATIFAALHILVTAHMTYIAVATTL